MYIVSFRRSRRSTATFNSVGVARCVAFLPTADRNTLLLYKGIDELGKIWENIAEIDIIVASKAVDDKTITPLFP